YFHYDSSSGSDILRKDWILGRVTAISNESSPSGARLADYRYEGLGRVVSRTNQVPSNDPVVQKISRRFATKIEFATSKVCHGAPTTGGIRGAFQITIAAPA